MAPTDFPPTIDIPAIADAVETYHQRARELAEARTERYSIEQARPDAEDADHQAAADAVEQGKPDPGGKNVARHEKQLDNARRREQALDIVTARAFDALVATIDTHADEWAEALVEREQAAREHLLEAIEALTDAHSALGDAMATRAWLSGFPDHATYAPLKFASRLRGIPTASGEPLHVAVAVAALRELTEPPAPREPRDAPPANQWPVMGVVAA